jgi:hypothetical protein
MTKQKAPSNTGTRAPAPVTAHAVDHGHDTHVDESSEYDATHQPEAVSYLRPSSLEAPPPRKGMKQRWIRHSLRGEADPRNLNRNHREGWRPRSPDTLPEDWRVYAVHANKAEGYIQVDDLVLMEIPEQVLAARKKATERSAAMQMAGVEYDLEKSQMPGLPIQRVHKTSVTHPGIQVAPDD